MADLCKSGLWDIQPATDCPICGAKPDTDCEAPNMTLAEVGEAMREHYLPPTTTATTAAAAWEAMKAWDEGKSFERFQSAMETLRAALTGEK